MSSLREIVEIRVFIEGKESSLREIVEIRVFLEGKGVFLEGNRGDLRLP